MRPIIFTFGIALFVLGAILAVTTWVPAQACLHPGPPCTGACPDVGTACLVPEFLFGVGLAITGAVLTGLGAWLKSRNEILADVLANLPQ
jgi:hypothetical protein